MLPDLILNPMSCVAVVTRLTGIALALVTAERLANWRDYEAGGIQSWDVLRERSPRLRVSRAAQWMFAAPGCMRLLIAQLTAAIGLVLRPDAFSIAAPCLVVACVTSTLYQWRNVDLGLSIADRAMGLILGALAIRMLAPGSPEAAEVVLAFIAFNACLAYFKSALYKLGDRPWRTGEQVLNIFGNQYTGSRRLASWLHDRPRLTQAAAWSVIALELTFPLSLIVGYPACLLWPVAGVVMHVGAAAGLGLRGFTWTFGAMYPAVVFIAHRVQGFMASR